MKTEELKTEKLKITKNLKTKVKRLSPTNFLRKKKIDHKTDERKTYLTKTKTKTKHA